MSIFILPFVIRLAPGTSRENKPKFIVFYSALLKVFSLFWFICKAQSPKVSMETCSTMVTVNQYCQSCKKNFKLRSQPFILGRYPARNVFLSFAVLMPGASISKLFLVFRHEARTSFYHQSIFLFPALLKYWASYQSWLINKLKDMKDVVWSGDGRLDLMGHSAKYGV